MEAEKLLLCRFYEHFLSPRLKWSKKQETMRETSVLAACWAASPWRQRHEEVLSAPREVARLRGRVTGPALARPELGH